MLLVHIVQQALMRRCFQVLFHPAQPETNVLRQRQKWYLALLVQPAQVGQPLYHAQLVIIVMVVQQQQLPTYVKLAIHVLLQAASLTHVTLAPQTPILQYRQHLLAYLAQLALCKARVTHEAWRFHQLIRHLVAQVITVQ